ncbi:MAG TPA: cupin domain-containing protein [Lichenihabitans sp.]|jgi:uncharacterized cupin superfamily protein|nr:cupin domain-containing protein [Lichenihabitans sp.]
MVERSQVVITSSDDWPRETWQDPGRGELSWVTLFSGDRTPTDSMTAGIAELPPGGGGRIPHRHEQPELYYIIEGTGLLTIDGRESVVAAGSAIFIPGNAAHCLRNNSSTTLRLLYVFPTDSFAEVIYRFDEPDASAADRPSAQGSAAAGVVQI